MNLENFPISPEAKRMLGYVTDGWYDKSYVGKWLYQIMGEELDLIAEPVEGLAYQAFVNTATWGLKYWEDLVGLPVREDLEYEVRRELINERLDKYHPVNPAWLEKFLSGITGREVRVIEHPKTGTFSIRIESGNSQYSLPFMFKRLDAVKQAHLQYNVTLVIKEQVDVFTGTAMAVAHKKKPLSEIEDHMISMNYLVKEKRYIKPTAKELGEITGLMYLTDEHSHLLFDQNGNLLTVSRKEK